MMNYKSKPRHNGVEWVSNLDLSRFITIAIHITAGCSRNYMNFMMTFYLHLQILSTEVRYNCYSITVTGQTTFGSNAWKTPTILY